MSFLSHIENRFKRGIAAGIVLFTVSSASGTLIFSEDFSGSSADINGVAPDVRPGSETWIAADRFNQDGSVDQGAGSTTLAFTPSDGNIYTLDASLRGVNGDGDWFALGFATGQSTIASTSDRFINGRVVGRAWMLLKGDASTSQNSALMNGTASNEAWSSFTNLNPGGDMDLRIVLDTTGGAGTWNATWSAKRPADGSYTVIRPTTTLLTESIDSVGLAISNAGVFGTIENFSLRDNTVIPEPSSAMLFSLGVMVLMCRARRLHSA